MALVFRKTSTEMQPGESCKARGRPREASWLLWLNVDEYDTVRKPVE